MASYLYRGRHRKPTHTRRNLATVGAAVSVTASGAFLVPDAAGARVPDPEPVSSTQRGGSIDWDVIARCESGNRNVENARSSASGFWQIIDGTWRANGGGQFAGRAIGASRSEQLIVAQRIAARRGSLADWNASKGCWGGRTGTTPGAAPQAVRAPQPAPRATSSVTGKRAADGSGSYVCTPDKLYFDACDPDTLGTVQQYPPYGRHALRPTSSAPVARTASATIQAAPTQTAGSPSRVASLLVAGGRGYIGTPYRWGGTTSYGMDCSGLVWTVLRDLGLNPPRTSAAQYAWTRRISADQARPGDLVFFYSPVSHVGIYLGNGLMLDAPKPGSSVGIRKVYPGAKYGRIPA